MRPDSTNPVWSLFRRRIFSQATYWFSVLGYNVRDRSANNYIYFIYFCIFWMVWIVAIFSLLGNEVAGVSNSIKLTSPLQAAVLLYTNFLVLWAIIQLWQVTRRSPFVFSEEDSFLLCQTPVSRRNVGMTWFFQEWLKASPPFAAGAVILSFALVELGPQQGLIFSKIIQYFGASLRALSIVLPLHMAIQACLWGIGASRLRCKPRQHNQGQPWLRLSAPLLVLFLVGSALIPGLYSTILFPLRFLLQAAFTGNTSGQIWLTGFSLGLLYLAISIFVLTISVKNINLSQAAQETRLHAAVQLARAFWSYDLADTLVHRQRLGTTHSPSRLPVRPGPWILVWKDAVQSLRSIRLNLIGRWVWVFGLSLGMFLPVNWAVQMLMGGLWTIALGGLATQRLRNDLAHWWLLRSLPLRANYLLGAELGLSCGSGVLLGWLALAFSGKPLTVCLVAAALLPLLTINTALGAARDILNHSKTRILMSPSIAEENVPRQSIEGTFRALAFVLIPFGILTWFFAHPNQVLAGLVTLPVAGLITILNVRSILAAYRWIE